MIIIKGLSIEDELSDLRGIRDNKNGFTIGWIRNRVLWCGAFWLNDKLYVIRYYTWLLYDEYAKQY
jgi:hypothetical protein